MEQVCKSGEELKVHVMSVNMDEDGQPLMSNWSEEGMYPCKSEGIARVPPPIHITVVLKIEMPPPIMWPFPPRFHSYHPPPPFYPMRHRPMSMQSPFLSWHPRRRPSLAKKKPFQNNHFPRW